MDRSILNLTNSVHSFCDFDLLTIVNEFSMTGLDWVTHFNSRDFTGSWDSIALYSISGAVNDIRAQPDCTYYPTDALMRYPAMKAFLEVLQFEKQSVRLLRLASGSEIKPHRDLGLAYQFGVFRLHIPLLTSSEIEFRVNDQIAEMGAGECWYADFDQLHSVRNSSDADRIHLVIDGVRNEWTDRFFMWGGYDLEAEKHPADQETIRATIRELSLTENETTRELIAQLKTQLREE